MNILEFASLSFYNTKIRHNVQFKKWRIFIRDFARELRIFKGLQEIRWFAYFIMWKTITLEKTRTSTVLQIELEDIATHTLEAYLFTSLFHDVKKKMTFPSRTSFRASWKHTEDWNQQVKNRVESRVTGPSARFFW